MPQLKYRLHLCRGDSIQVPGYFDEFMVAEYASFGTTEEIADFLANSKEVWFKEYPSLFCLCGGAPVRRKGLVRKKPGEDNALRFA